MVSFFSRDVLEHHLVQAQIGHEPLELTNFRSLQASVLLFPTVKGLTRSP